MPYSCGFCGKKFDNIEARAKCELQCAERIRKEEELKKKELANFEREALEKEIDQLEKVYLDKVQDYVEKYHKLPPNFDFSYKLHLTSNGGNEDDFWADLISELLG